MLLVLLLVAPLIFFYFFLTLCFCTESNPFKDAMRAKKRKASGPPSRIVPAKLPSLPSQPIQDKNRVIDKPIRPSRRLPRSEKHRPITLPKLGDTLSPWTDDEGRSYKGSEFIARTGVLDTDSVMTRGVAVRLIQSTILPRDEDGFFGPSEDCMDIAESGGLKVDFLIYLALSTLLL